MKNQQMSRLDRIEKELEVLIGGIGELRESQKKTDEMQKETGQQIGELREFQKETGQQISKLLESIQKSQEESRREMKELGDFLKDVGRQLGEIGIVQGEVAEDLF